MTRIPRLFVVLFCFLLAACSTAQPAPTPPPAPTTAPTAAAVVPTAAPAPSVASEPAPAAAFDPERAAAGIAMSLEVYGEAFSQGDAARLATVVDQSNAPFRRLVEERMNGYTSSILGGGRLSYEVISVEERPLGFVLAEVALSGTGVHYRWLFREVDGVWLLSEPTEEQIGERYEFESEHFVFRTYPWADPILDEIVALMEEAYTVVTEQLGAEIEFKPIVDLRPIFGITPPQSANALAYYRAANRPRGDQMVIFAPDSYAFGGFNGASGWQPDLGSTLVHEFTHLVNNRAFLPIARMRDWMYEGLAEYISKSPRAGEVSAAVASGQIIPIVVDDGGANPQDLDHLYLLERDRSLAYGLSYALVAFIIEEKGGLEAFWTFAETLVETSGSGTARYDAAMQVVFNQSYAEFDAEWRAWLNENY